MTKAQLLEAIQRQATPELRSFIARSEAAQTLIGQAAGAIRAKREIERIREADSPQEIASAAWDRWAAAMEALSPRDRQIYMTQPDGSEPSTIEDLGHEGLPPGYAWTDKAKTRAVGDPLFGGGEEGKLLPGTWLWRTGGYGPSVFLLLAAYNVGGLGSSSHQVYKVWVPGEGVSKKGSALRSAFRSTQRVPPGGERSSPDTYSPGGRSTGWPVARLVDVYPDPIDRKQMYDFQIRKVREKQARAKAEKQEIEEQRRTVGPYYAELESLIVVDRHVPDTVETKALRGFYRHFGVKASIRVRRYSMASGVSFGPSGGRQAFSPAEQKVIKTITPTVSPSQFGLYPHKTEDRSDYQTDYHDPGGFRVAWDAVPAAKYYLARAAKKAGLELTDEGRRVLKEGRPSKGSKKGGSKGSKKGGSKGSKKEYEVADVGIRYVSQKGDWVNIGTLEDGKKKRYGWSTADSRWARKQVPPGWVLEALRDTDVPSSIVDAMASGTGNRTSNPAADADWDRGSRQLEIAWSQQPVLPLRRNPSGHVPAPSAHPNVQSVLFDRTKWTKGRARRWLRDNDFGYSQDRFDVTAQYIRVRQADPGTFDRLRTIAFSKSKGIKAIVGYY